ncbi:MAG: arginase family protein [Planctomycetes bacterium]|nr:arginase family protein [Planctomycetota bacterium]
MRTNVTVFPFDLFGGAGTGAGAQLLGDAVHEILDDTEAETRPCRADCLRGNVEVQEFAFETMQQIRSWRKTGRAAARETLKAGDFLLWLGGNHLSVLPVLEELGRDCCVVQFDAHLDVYAFHDTTAELSHGNFLRHFETPRPRILNIGHRDLFLTPDEISETFEATYSAVDVATNIDRVATELRAKVAGAKRVWIDLDADAFDPSVCPAVRQPLPFGLAAPTFLKLLDAVWSDKVVGMSVSEFDPECDVRETGLNLLGWLVEFVLLRVHSPR